MDRHYTIPANCRSYSREPRPYRPKPAPAALPPRRAKPPAKIQFFKSTLPTVSKLKPLARYTPAQLTPLKKVEASRFQVQRPARPTPAESASRPAPPPRAEGANRQQALYEAEQRRRQQEHQRQQQAIQREYQRRQEIERQRQQARARHESKRLDKIRRAENRPPAPQPLRNPPSAPPFQSGHDEDHHLEEVVAPSRYGRHEAPSREDLKRDIRRKLAAAARANADDEDDSAASTPVKNSGSCAGNVIFFLIVGTILYFAVCSGIIDELLK